MAAFDDRITKQKQSTVFIQVQLILLQTQKEIYSLKYHYHFMIKAQTANATLLLATENNTSALFR